MTHFAREYGNALFELAMEENIAERISSELAMVAKDFSEMPQYVQLLSIRSIDCEERLRLLDEAYKDTLHPYLLNFLKLITSRGAVTRLLECEEFFRKQYNEHFGIAEASAVSATELSGEQKDALRGKLEKITGKTVKITFSVDPKLIGGLQVDVEGKRYDNTIRTRLERLRTSLAEGE